MFVYKCILFLFLVAPSVITTLTNETVAINDNINIICTATGLPPPTVSWMKGGAPTFGNNLLTEVTVNIDGTPSVTTSTLVLAGVTLTDEGEYTCIASSSEFSETNETVVKNIIIIGKQNQLGTLINNYTYIFYSSSCCLHTSFIAGSLHSRTK